MPDSHSGTPTDPQAAFMKTWWKAAAVCLLVSLFPILGYILPWQDVAAKVSLLTILLAFLSPGLGRLLKHIFGRRVHRRIRWLASIVDPDMTVTISDRWRGDNTYEEVKAYLGASCSLKARHLKGEAPRNDAADKHLEFNMQDGEEVADEKEIEGTSFTVWWSAFTREIKGSLDDETGYTVYYQERHRDLVLNVYLPQVRREGCKLIRKSQRQIMTNNLGQDRGWSHMMFNHPMTFDTLAMDPKTKQEIKTDLETFMNGRDYYKKLGRPWKRGYLLYGPPGTGKSSMVAAMANCLNYDVYDIELTSVMSNTQLRNLLIGTKSKSVIVIEDIDCSLDLTGARKDDVDGNDGGGASCASLAAANVAREDNKVVVTSSRSQVTLSGLLNFIDGLWSACGEERIIVFTTNHIDKLDPALIRRGRMDMHIEMSYCGFEAFKFLAKLYLKVESHRLFGAIEKLPSEVEMTPADVAENLMPKSHDDDAESCLQRLVGELESCRMEARKANRARTLSNEARVVPQGATDEDGRRRSPRIRAPTDSSCLQGLEGARGN